MTTPPPGRPLGLSMGDAYSRGGLGSFRVGGSRIGQAEGLGEAVSPITDAVALLDPGAVTGGITDDTLGD